jgi:hypothetical protein
MDKAHKLAYLAIGLGMLGATYAIHVNAQKRNHGARRPVSEPPRQAWPLQFGSYNFAGLGQTDRFSELEAAGNAATFVGDSFAEWERYAGLPFSNTAGGVFRVDPGIEFTGGFTDAITVKGSHNQYQGDNPLEFQEPFIQAPPWLR